MGGAGRVQFIRTVELTVNFLSSSEHGSSSAPAIENANREAALELIQGTEPDDLDFDCTA